MEIMTSCLGIQPDSLRCLKPEELSRVTPLGRPVSARGWRRSISHALAGKNGSIQGPAELNGDIPRSVLLTGIMRLHDIRKWNLGPN